MKLLKEFLLNESDEREAEPFVVNIEKLTLDNSEFRSVEWTGRLMQMTVMSIPVGEEIGLEVHEDGDQFIRIESGKAKVIMGLRSDKLTFEKEVEDDWAVFIPAGYLHNIINIGDDDLKVYVIYAPPEHEHGAVHSTKDEADHPHIKKEK